MKKICKRGCGKEIEWRGKVEGKKGSTGFFETDTGIEHSYTRCDNLIKNGSGRNSKLF